MYDDVKHEALQIVLQFNKTTAVGNIILKCDKQKSEKNKMGQDVRNLFSRGAKKITRRIKVYI